jgi:hypothetical protein
MTFLINVLMLPAILSRTLSQLTWFSTFTLAGTTVSYIILIYMMLKFRSNSQEFNQEQYNIEPVTVNTDFSFVNWGGMVPYLTVYSGLWENTASILQLYSEFEKPSNFLKSYTKITVCVVSYIFVQGVIGYLTFGQ